jgi:pimeloyl-ACP methyl ester carboxylesterase
MPYALRRPRLWYERRGNGEPLLLITGFAISAAVFEPVRPLYERHFECVVYDNRGAGRSGRSPWPASIPQFAGDAVRLLDALGLESAHVYGASMGGMIAQELAIRFPERVRGLVLAGTTPGGPRAVRPAVSELAAVLGQAAGALREPGRPWLAAMLFSESFRREQPDRVRELLRYFGLHRASAWGVNAHWWATVYHDTVSRLPLIQAPTLVMHGERDAMSPVANARMLAERIPDAELAIVPDAGHAFALERPEESLSEVLGWLRRRAPIAPGAARAGLAARGEPVTRALGLPVGALRTGVSLLALRHNVQPRPESNQRGKHVASNRRAA